MLTSAIIQRRLKGFFGVFFFFWFLSICQVLRNRRKHVYSLSYILNSNYADLFKKNQCVHAVYWAFDEVLRMLKQNIVYTLKELSLIRISSNKKIKRKIYSYDHSILSVRVEICGE